MSPILIFLTLIATGGLFWSLINFLVVAEINSEHQTTVVTTKPWMYIVFILSIIWLVSISIPFVGLIGN